MRVVIQWHLLIGTACARLLTISRVVLMQVTFEYRDMRLMIGKYEETMLVFWFAAMLGRCQ